MKARIAEKRAELCKAQQELRMKLLLISEQEYDRAESCKSCAEKVGFNDMIEESIHNLQCQIDGLDEDMYQLEAQELFEVEGEKIVNQMPKAQFCFTDLLAGKWGVSV